MIGNGRLASRFRRDRGGATLIEFAILLPVMLTLILGFLELSYNAYMHAILQGSLNEAARSSTLESADTSAIDQMVRDRVDGISSGVTYASSRTSYASFSDVGTMEDFTDRLRDGVYDGVRQSDECYVDENGSGTFDAKGQAGQGGADDIVAYTMTASYPLLFPYTTVIGFPDRLEVSATTVLRNQPYGIQATRDVTCSL